MGVDVSMLKFLRLIQLSEPRSGLCCMAYHTAGEEKRKLQPNFFGGNGDLKYESRQIDQQLPDITMIIDKIQILTICKKLKSRRDVVPHRL